MKSDSFQKIILSMYVKTSQKNIKKAFHKNSKNQKNFKKYQLACKLNKVRKIFKKAFHKN